MVKTAPDYHILADSNSNRLNMSRLQRRKFLKTAGLTATAFTIVPRFVLGKGYVAPSDKLNLATIGAGGKGRGDIFNAYNDGKNNVVAICDIDTDRCKDAVNKFDKARFFGDFRQMFEKMHKDIDAVTISTPDHTHAVIAMAAMQLGKHVYVQKPLTHNLGEARQLTETARKYKVVSQMGNQGASNPGQRQMLEWFDQGLIGDVNEVFIWTNRPVWPQGIAVPTDKPEMPKSISKESWDVFIGPAQYVDYHPLYHPFKWRGWWNFGTGALGDMGCHLIDPPFRVLGLGYPKDVECSVGQTFSKDWDADVVPEGCPVSSLVNLTFDATAKNKSEVKVRWYDGGLRPPHPALIPSDENMGDENGSNGVIMMGSKGIITCGTYGRNPKLFLNSGERREMAKDYSGGLKYYDSPEHGHQVLWTEACKAGFNSAEHKELTSSFDYAGPLTETVLMGNLAIRSYNLVDGKNYPGRKKLLWDGNKMQITNFDDANQFVKREYRKGW